MPAIEEIALCCKELRLSSNIVENIKKIEEADKELFLLRLFQLEIKHRRHNRRLRNIKNAGFYTLKGFSNYAFDDIKLPDALTVDAIIAGEFIQNKQNLIMYGNPGTGKTHLATAIGHTACKNDLKVGFFRTAGLVNKLLEAKRKNEFDIFLRKLDRLDLIIADEWGYVPLDKEGSQLLFHVISECYERKSLIITTNLEFSRWVNIFYDKDMTTAMIDRLVHHSHLLIFDGESWRMKNSLISH
jgi:DNA replication protein DnaC